ncbi:prephenate dehydratase [Natronosporangium hydrolyticum]|uniref:Prephenate dehydratase n=1 Tax=Natronosporangium hydrolyticum TaxID=2811111 RepID=A0A895YFT7_9ACTN|nr:prephenate dehydratase [Natronosporangium hydrolyticum]QSB14955.1 prephenate dehydratase [Natronosporangium hydrolyticum]
MPGVPPTRFVYLGPEGTFAEQALRTLAAAERGTRTPARSVPEALDAVRGGEADAALVPLENSIGGAIGITLDELAGADPLVISREVVLPVEFVLAARAPAPPESLATVIAHPQAAAQCRRWLRQHAPDATVVDALSNSAAAEATAAGDYQAAICAPVGAARHRLTVIADKIADHPHAVTRFALVTRPGPPPAPTGDDVTSLAVSISHDRVGALLAVLMELAVRGVNLTRIESRPTGERLGRYAFFLDCTGHVAEARMGEALQGLRRVCAEVRFLGSYPRHRLSGAAPEEPVVTGPPGLSDRDFADSAAWLSRIRHGQLG